jgi:hypothetical protein
VSFAAPFRQAAFAVIWTATLISNVGGWMYSAASGWLMTSLNPDPFAAQAGAGPDIYIPHQVRGVLPGLLRRAGTIEQTPARIAEVTPPVGLQPISQNPKQQMTG